MSDSAHHPAPHAHAHAHDGGHEEHEEHVHSVQHYVTIWGVLIVLFTVSVIGPTLGIKVVTLITAFGVATIKAGMVVKYFMHLDVEKRFVHYFLATALVFMFLFFAAVAPDVMKHEGTQWVNVSAAEAVKAGLAAGVVHHGDEHAPPGEHGGEPKQEH